MYILWFIIGCICVLFSLFALCVVLFGTLMIIMALTQDLDTLLKWAVRIFITPFALGFALYFGSLFYAIPFYVGLAFFNAGH